MDLFKKYIMKTIKCIIWTILILLSANINAQDIDRSSNVDNMHSQKWQFLVDKAQLAPTDIAKVQPVFLQYEKSMWLQHQQNRDFLRQNFKKDKNIKPDFAKWNDRYVEMEVKQSSLLKGYHLQLRRLMTPEKLFRYYLAERDFKRKLLQDMQDHRDPRDRK